MVCPVCGSNVRKKDVFCPKCGARINGTVDQGTNHTQDTNDTSDDFVTNEELKKSITEIQNNMEKSAKRRRTTSILAIIVGVIVIAAVVIDLIVFGGSDL